MNDSLDSGLDALRKRHAFMMEQHEIAMRRSRTRTVVLIGFLALVLLLSLLILINPGLVGAERRPVGPEVLSLMVIYSAALLVLVTEIGLLLRSRARAIEASIRMIGLAFELGKAVGQQADAKDSRRA